MPLLILLLALPIFAQSSYPLWIEDSWRSSHYPVSEWYIGFAKDKINSGLPNSKNYQAIERDAQNKLSESIQVQIKSSSEFTTSVSETRDGNNVSGQVNKDYEKSISTSTNAVLAKVETKSYFDPKTGSIYAFAFVRKSDLAEFYESKINFIIQDTKNNLEIAKQLYELGKKKSALDKIKASEDGLKNDSLKIWQSYLQTVDANNTLLKSHEQHELSQKINKLKLQIESNTSSIYLEVQGNDYLSENLPALLQEKGCNCTIVKTPNEVDYIATITAKFKTCDESTKYKEVFCYASANAVINNSKVQKPVNVNIPEAKGGWTNSNKEKATEEAFKELTNSLAEKISQTINQ